jgi:four helix bundle protein
LFAKAVRAFVKRLPRTICNIEDVKQLVRSSGSVGANFIEANESLGKKEAKESRYWLRLIDTDANADLERVRDELIQESTELMNICGAIVQKTGQ